MIKRLENIFFVFLIGFLVTARSADNCAEAGSSSTKIFVNDVEVTGLANQEFKNCTVKFDSKGDVHIKAPGYKIKRLDSGNSGKSSGSSTTVVTEKKKGKLKQKYFLVTEQYKGSKVWDNYSLIIEGSVVKTFSSSDGVILEDISKHLINGKNLIVITASKKDKFPGGSKSVWYRVIIGEGHEEGNKIVINKTLGQFTRKGSDAESDSKTITLDAK